MKKFAAILSGLILAGAAVFAQGTDFQPLAVVKLNKSETITVKNLKTRVAFIQKQYEAYGVKEVPVEQRKAVLENLINEKLICQAAAKEGITVADSEVDATFLSTFSSQMGMQLTEAQLKEIIETQMKITLDDYIKTYTGMSYTEYKAYLKAQLIVQKYVYVKKAQELQTVAATDEDIRKAYEMNKTSFKWDDMQKLFLVMVPKGTDAVAARAKAVDMKNQYAKDKKKADAFKLSQDNGTVYAARDLLVAKTTQMAQQLGWSYDKILELFDKEVGFISDITETDTDFQFYAVLKKYDAKFLSLSDIVQPETTVTVYDYIKGNLTQQKQSAYFEQAGLDLAKQLDTAANVDRKKTGDDLTKLLTW